MSALEDVCIVCVACVCGGGGVVGARISKIVLTSCAAFSTRSPTFLFIVKWKWKLAGFTRRLNRKWRMKKRERDVSFSCLTSLQLD